MVDLLWKNVRVNLQAAVPAKGVGVGNELKTRINIEAKISTF